MSTVLGIRHADGQSVDAFVRHYPSVSRAQAAAALEEAEELLEFKGMRDGDLHAALSQTCDVLVTGDTNLQDQQNLVRYDLAIVVLHRIRRRVPGWSRRLQLADLHSE